VLFIELYLLVSIRPPPYFKSSLPVLIAYHEQNFHPTVVKGLAEVLKERLYNPPTDIKTLYSLGEIFIEMYLYGNAISSFQEVVYFNPEQIDGHERLRYAYDESMMGQ
jgi:hypothetical protein